MWYLDKDNRVNVIEKVLKENKDFAWEIEGFKESRGM